LARETLESAHEPSGAPVRTPQRTAFCLAIPRTLLALADEVIE
jgi:hypothetical protein